MNTWIVLQKVTILFIILMTGFTARKLKVFGEEATLGLNSLLIRILLPALILNSMQKPFSTTLFHESGIILLVSFLYYGFTFGLSWIFVKMIRPNANASGAYRFMVMFSNVGFMGFPIIKAVLGPQYLFYASVFNLPFNLLIFTVGVMLLNENNHHFQADIKHMINPGSVAVIIGFLFFLTSFRMPFIIEEPIRLLGESTIPLSMFLIGALLAKGNLFELLRHWKLGILAVVRLLLIPIILWFALIPFFKVEIVRVLVLISAMPAAAATPILAEEYGGNGQVAALGVFVTTLLSILSIPLVAFLILH